MASWSDILYKLKDILASIGTNGTLIDDSLQDVQANQVLQLNRTISGYATPLSYTVVDGTVSSGTIYNAKYKDRTYLVIDESSTGLEIIFNFTLPSGQVVRRINFNGRYFGSSGHKVDVYIYNNTSEGWDEISTTNFKDIVPTENDIEIIWDLDNEGYTASDNTVLIKLEHDNGGDDTHKLYIDRITCGDYKPQQLLSDMSSKLDDLMNITDRGYIHIKAEGDNTIYDLPDSRVRTSDKNAIQIIGDMIDDADFKGIRIPVVEQFNYSVTGAYRWATTQWIRKIITQPTSWSDLSQSTTLRKNKYWNFCELQDKRVLEFYWIPAGEFGAGRIRWRVLPENFTANDFQNIPSNYQTLTQSIFTDITSAMVRYTDAYYFDGKVYLYLEYDTGAVRSAYAFEMTFNPEIGFTGGTLISDNPGGGFAAKAAAATKGKDGRPYFVYEYAPDNRILLYKLSGVESGQPEKYFTLPGGKLYQAGKQMSIAPYYGDSTDDSFLVAIPTSGSIVTVFLVRFSTGAITELSELNFADIPSSDAYIGWIYTLPSGESVISYYDDDEGDQFYYHSTDYGVTYTAKSWDFFSVTDSRPFLSTDKFYMFAGSTSGVSTYAFINPFDLSNFSEALLDYDDLTVEFSTALVSGSYFDIINYKSEHTILVNESEYNKAGVAVTKPFLTDVVAKDYFTEVSLGNVTGQSAEIKFGANDAVGTSNEVIWDYGGDYNWLGAASTLNFTSDNAADTSAGDGARTLDIYGLDANYALQSETIILNGTTIVPSANTYRRLYRAIVATEGATLAANTGTLYCFTGTETDGVPNDVTKIYMAMNANHGQTLMAVYTVPAGKTAVLRSAWITSGGNKAVTGQLFVRPFGGAKNLKMDVDILDYLFFRPFCISQAFAEKTDIWIEGKVDVGSIKLSAGFDLLLVDN